VGYVVLNGPTLNLSQLPYRDARDRTGETDQRAHYRPGIYSDATAVCNNRRNKALGSCISGLLRPVVMNGSEIGARSAKIGTRLIGLMAKWTAK
jgi:hypothetical protein